MFFLTRILKVGGGSTAPGHYALKFEPELVRKLAAQIPQNVIITGTNGKTTTSRLLAHLVKKQGVKVARNSTGSNLERGVASALIKHSDLFGKVKETDLGIWELDEAAFNKVVFQIKPQIIVFLNVLRDQLDRYGEVDTVTKKWSESLQKIDWSPVVLLNGGDENIRSLSEVVNLDKYEFRVKGKTSYQEMFQKQVKTAHKDDFLAQINKQDGLNGVALTLKYPSGQLKLYFPVAGVYHVYDLLAAFGVYFLLNLGVDKVDEALKDYSPAFGRVEQINLGDKKGYIFLIKNPAGATLVAETIAPEIKNGDRLLVALNDNFADGTDVSWIWDAQFEKLSTSLLFPPRSKYGVNPGMNTDVIPANAGIYTNRSRNKYGMTIICSGSRAYDMALRLKYASLPGVNLEVVPNIRAAFDKAKEGLSGRLFVLPTYTALLELQKILTKEGIKKHYWKED